MLQITGLDQLQRELDQAQCALEELAGELGTVRFDPFDPASIEAAINSAYHIVDSRAGQYAANPIVRPLIEQMKESYRSGILEKAAIARLQADKDE